MAIFFRQLQGHTFNGNLADLLAEQQRFRAQQFSGLMEIENSNSICIVVVLAKGETVNAYLLQEEARLPTVLLENLQRWEDATFSVRSLPLSDVATRLLWLALDSQPGPCFEIRGAKDWQDWLNACQDEHVTGVVEIHSEACDGFFYLHNGQRLENESIFALQENLYSQVPFQAESSPWKVRLNTPRPETLAWQSLHLRVGAGQWFWHTLNRYQRIAGQRLTQILTHHLLPTIREWDWEIGPSSNTLEDRHFFARPSLAAEAYRALFMKVGEQMGIVLGSQLAQRFLSQAFEQIPPGERSVLTSHRLLPAAFVD